MGKTESKPVPDFPKPEDTPQPDANGITQYSETLYTRHFVNQPDFLAFTIDNFLSPEECQALIERSERHGYEAAQLNIGNGDQILRTDIRQSDRAIIDDVAMAEGFWARLQPHVPAEFMGMVAVGLNERMRFLRYDKGGYFKPHYDGSYVRPDGGESSYVTFFLFLNEGYEGGESTFLHPSTRYCKEIGDKWRLPVEPATGRLLVFQHNILHEGSLLEGGRKYALRTDVMYRMRDGDEETPPQLETRDPIRIS